MASGGTYSITSPTTIRELPAPESAEWEHSVLGAGLNGIPRLNSYNKHRWSWAALEGPDMEALIDFFYEQADGGAQLTALETDSYTASGSCEKYSTVRYTDFLITAISTVTRGLPTYQNPSIEFEVYCGA